MNKINMLILTTLTGLSILLSGCSDTDEASKGEGSVPIKEDVKPPSKKDDIAVPPVVIPTPIPNPYKVAGWYAKTEVTAIDSDGTVYQHKTAGVFGELVQSSDAQDQHDIPGYAPALFQVIFLPEFSTDTSTGYFSEYKNFDENSTNDKKVWTFQIKNQNTVDLSGDKIAINLNGIYDVKYRDDRGKVEFLESTITSSDKLDKLTLVDVDFQVEYSISQLANANLKMTDGAGTPVHTRTFRWVFGSVDSADYAALPAPRKSAGRVSSSDFTLATKTEKTGKFGVPPR